MNCDNKLQHAFNWPNGQHTHPYPSMEQSGAAISVPMLNIHAHLRIKLAVVESVKVGQIKSCPMRCAAKPCPVHTFQEQSAVAFFERMGTYCITPVAKEEERVFSSQSVVTLPVSPKRSFANGKLAHMA